ncbi:hypothetical protein GCM10029964_076980 [Kibdelosporangium lantanae]
MTPLVWVHGEVPLSKPPLTITWSPQAAALAAGAVAVSDPTPSTNMIATARGLRLISRPFHGTLQGLAKSVTARTYSDNVAFLPVKASDDRPGPSGPDPHSQLAAARDLRERVFRYSRYVPPLLRSGA